MLGRLVSIEKGQRAILNALPSSSARRDQFKLPIAAARWPRVVTLMARGGETLRAALKTPPPISFSPNGRDWEGAFRCGAESQPCGRYGRRPSARIRAMS